MFSKISMLKLTLLIEFYVHQHYLFIANILHFFAYLTISV